MSGFKITRVPGNLSSPARLVLNTLTHLRRPVLWFEALMSAQATSVSQKDAALLVTGQMTPMQFMAAVQAALAAGENG